MVGIGQPLVRAVDLRKVYRLGSQDLEVLGGVSLQLSHREMVAISGPSGSGKSTLMHLVGLLDSPTSGQLWFEGTEVGNLSAADLTQLRRTTVGFVFQTFNLLPRVTAVDNVALPLLYQGVAARERRKRAAEALGRVGMGHRLRHRPAELSGGEQQRVAIARAVVGHPKLVLADEPTGNLDSASGKQVLTLLRQLVVEGHAVLLVTHDATIAAQADRRINLMDGRIV